MFEVIKGAAAMAVVVTALVVIASAIVTHDSSPAPLALAVGMVIGGVLGWRRWQREQSEPAVIVRDMNGGTLIETVRPVRDERPCKICGQSPCVEAHRGVAAHVEWPKPPKREEGI